MPTTTTPAEHTYVIDTSVLLSDPRAMLRFKEQEVVLPVVVITELEGKRCASSMTCVASTVGSMPRCLSVATEARCASSSTTPTRRHCLLDSGWGTTTLAFWRWPRTSRTRVGG